MLVGAFRLVLNLSDLKKKKNLGKYQVVAINQYFKSFAVKRSIEQILKFVLLLL